VGLPSENEAQLEDVLEILECTHLAMPGPRTGDGGVDFFEADVFIGILERSACVAVANRQHRARVSFRVSRGSLIVIRAHACAVEATKSTRIRGRR